MTDSLNLGIIHDGERAWALELSPDAAAIVRAGLETLVKLANAMESLAETEIARSAVEFNFLLDLTAY